MKLNLDEIRSVTLGAVSVELEEGYLRFHRFTKEQEDFYAERRETAIRSTAGVKLSFRTDSTRLFLKALTEKVHGRSYFTVDVFVNGELLDSLSNFEKEEIPLCYAKASFPMGEYEKEFELPEGEKEVLVHLPWSLGFLLKEVSLSDGASFLPVKPKKKLLCFGDSITQGFDALHPSRRYTAQLADYLQMEEWNKAIGGEQFRPRLALLREEFTPDLITVAYGTNDWARSTKEEFEENCRGYFENLVKTYPDTPILAITPLWRRIWQWEKPCGPYRSVDAFIKKEAEKYDNLTVLDGFHFLPHFCDYFGDLTVHPSDVAFDRYFENIRAFLEENSLTF